MNGFLAALGLVLVMIFPVYALYRAYRKGNKQSTLLVGLPFLIFLVAMAINLFSVPFSQLKLVSFWAALIVLVVTYAAGIFGLFTGGKAKKAAL